MTTSTLRPPATPVARSGPVSKPVKSFGRSRGVTRSSHKVVIYGTGGIGKSSQAKLAPAPLFADIERSTEDLDVERADGIESWADLRAWLQSGDFEGVQTIVIDSATKAEEWCVAYVIGSVPSDKGQKVTRIEEYGYGKGYVHVFEEWRRFLGDLERHYRQGRNVVLICHEQVSLIPNPMGDDFKRYQPRLQSSEKANVLAATKEWADHVLFISYDVLVKDGKGKGSGSRTIYSVETPTHMAKTRTLDGLPIVFERGSNVLWESLLARPMIGVDDLPPTE